MPSINNLKIVSGGTEYDVPIGKGLQVDMQTWSNSSSSPKNHTFSHSGAVLYIAVQSSSSGSLAYLGGGSSVTVHVQGDSTGVCAFFY